jgi:hypothetical protein
MLSAARINLFRKKTMKAVALLTLLLPIAAQAARCPEVNGQAPKLAAEAGGYQLYYFTEGFSADEQRGALYVSKGGEQFSFEAVEGYRDWFSGLTVGGDVSGLSVVSASYGFAGAWVMENGVKKVLKEGRAYVPACER